MDSQYLEEFKNHSQVILLPWTTYCSFLLTKIRNRSTETPEFVMYADRLIRILIEAAMSELPMTPTTISTPTGSKWQGYELSSSNPLCAISIMRAGESMEYALRDLLPGIAIGKILIQRDESKNGSECKFYYSKLPYNLKHHTILLLDPMLATGGSAAKAIHCLVAAGALLSQILFINLITCPTGLRSLLTQFPTLRILTACIDPELSSQNYILPGLGDFGDRYFGTHCTE